MSEPTLFEKIVAREIPAEVIYEDDRALCFRDIAPQAPIHFLLIPKRALARLGEATPEDTDLLGHLMTLVPLIARQEGFAEKGFRVVINSGPEGGEAVPHLHLHILAGRQLQWPPG